MKFRLITDDSADQTLLSKEDYDCAPSELLDGLSSTNLLVAVSCPDDAFITSDADVRLATALFGLLMSTSGHSLVFKSIFEVMWQDESVARGAAALKHGWQLLEPHQD